MNAERDGGALILRAGIGEWYNQPDRGLWDMGEDVQPLPPARWHTEVDEAIRAQNSLPSVVVIDITGMTYLVAHDFGFLLNLSSQLGSAGISLAVVARPNARRAYRIIRDAKPTPFQINMVSTLKEALEIA